MTDLETKLYNKTVTYDLNKIIINPNNARFYETVNSASSTDEIYAINNIIKLNHTHVINLAKSISEMGLNPSRQPIVMPLKDKPGYVMAYDGNRRLTSLKLISIYKNRLDDFDLTDADKATLKSLSINNTRIVCTESNDLNYVNQLLLQIHAESTPGVGQLNWVPEAKAYHLSKTNQTISQDLSFIYLLQYLVRNSTDEKIDFDSLINKSGWNAKLKRFLPSKEYMLLLGIEFSTNNSIICYPSIKDLKNTITRFFKDIYQYPAREIAQTKDLQNQFMYKFVIDNNLSNINLNNHKQIFYPIDKQFQYSKDELNKNTFESNMTNFLNANKPNNDSFSTQPPGKIDTPSKPNNDSFSTQPPGKIDTPSKPNNDNFSTQPPSNINTPSKSNTENNLSSYKKNNSNTDSMDTDSKNKENSTTQPLSKKENTGINNKKVIFFSTLKHQYVASDDIKNQALISIYDEIIKFSKRKNKSEPYPYQTYPIAATILFRGLVEQCLKYLLRQTLSKEFNEMKNKLHGTDPALGDLIKKVNQRKNEIFTNSTLRRQYTALFDESFKAGLDLAAHHSRNDVLFLEEKSKNFLPIADYILNTKLSSIES